MPETLAGSLLATLVIAALGGVSAYVLRRWGDEPAPDPLLSWLEGVMGDVRPALMSGPDDEAAGRRRRWFRRRDAGIESDEQSEEDGGTSPTEAASGTGAIPYAGAISPETQTQSMPAPPGGVEPETARYAERYAREQREQGSERREAEERKPARRRSTRPPGLDHVPFEPGDREAAEEAERTFRDRFRLGLKKTRDYLNRDVREVFGTGPVQESFDDLEEALVRADVGVMAATQLSDELRERGRDLHSDNLMPTLKEHMRALLSDSDRRLRVNPEGLSLWLIVGVNGTGKTTTIAKLAKVASDRGFGVVLAAGDTFRAAAIEQLETWGERLGLDVVRQHPGADPGAVVFDAIEHAKARGYDLLIVDTAGRLHTKTPLMEELRKVRRIIDRTPGLLTECLLVLDATTGQNGIAQARAFRDATDLTGLVLAKLDGTAKGGITFAVERELGVPVKAVGLGEKATDLAPFDPDDFVDALFDE